MPKTPFGIREERKVAFLAGKVLHLNLPDLQRAVNRDKDPVVGFYPVILTFKTGITQPVPANRPVLLKGLGHRLPGGGPIVPALVVVEVNIPARPVHGDTVKPEPQHPPAFRRTVERVSRRIIGNNCAIIHRAQVINPRHGRIRPFNYILPPLIVEISISHPNPSPFIINLRLFAKKP